MAKLNSSWQEYRNERRSSNHDELAESAIATIQFCRAQTNYLEHFELNGMDVRRILRQLDNQTDTVLIVTHDIEEAIFLSDRVFVMTNGPAATIGEIVGVPIPRPRDKLDFVHLKEYVEVHERLMYLLMDAFAVNHQAAAA